MHGNVDQMAKILQPAAVGPFQLTYRTAADPVQHTCRVAQLQWVPERNRAHATLVLPSPTIRAEWDWPCLCLPMGLLQLH